MPKYKNISRNNLSLIHKGRKIKISPGQIIEGPDVFKMYRDLKEVDDTEVERYEKAVSKVMRYNPVESKKLNLNMETFAKVNSVDVSQPIEENIKEVRKAINYVESIKNKGKPLVHVIVSGTLTEFNRFKKKLVDVVEYDNYRIFYSEEDIPNTNPDFILTNEGSQNVVSDYVSEVVKLGMINKVDIPKIYKIENADKSWVRSDVKQNYNNNYKCYMSIGTLTHNFRQYKDMLEDLSKQKTKLKFEILMAPNYAGIYKSCSEALNIMKDLASGEIINLCHQDLRIQPLWINGISSHIRQLNMQKIKWGVLGMAGALKDRSHEYNVIYLGDGKSGKSFSGVFRKLFGTRKEVQTVDELALIMRTNDNIRFDEVNFDHYHFYGADICLNYMANGFTNYAIDSECVHLSDGQSNMDSHKNEFMEHSARLYHKWKHTFPTWKTTTANFMVSEGIIIPLIFLLINQKRGNKDLPQVLRVK